MLRGTRAVWKREMRKWRRNKVQLVSSLLLPVLFLIVVGNAYSGTFSNVPIAVINLDSQTPGQVYGQVLQNSTALTIVTTNISVQDANTMIDDGKIFGYILIPANFSKSFLPLILGGVTPSESTRINVTVDNTNMMVSQALMAIAAQALNQTLRDPSVASWFYNKTHNPMPTTGSYINNIDKYSSGYNFMDFLAPGILAMTVLFTSLFAAGMPIILDREVGYFDMLLSTPVNRTDIVLGFTLAGVSKVVAQATFVLIIAIFVGVHMTLSILTILSIYVLVILLSLGFVGISIALSVKIEITAFQFVNGLINFPVFFLSGSFYPAQSLPDWLRVVVYVNPMTYAVDGLRAVMIKGTGLVNILPDVIIVGIFALLTQLLGNLALYMALSGRKIRRRHKGKSNERKDVAANQETTITAEKQDGSAQQEIKPHEQGSSAN
jgi:ABC-2 type transport system permease protein